MAAFISAIFKIHKYIWYFPVFCRSANVCLIFTYVVYFNIVCVHLPWLIVCKDSPMLVKCWMRVCGSADMHIYFWDKQRMPLKGILTHRFRIFRCAERPYFLQPLRGSVAVSRERNELYPILRLKIEKRKTKNEPWSNFLLCVYLTQVRQQKNDHNLFPSIFFCCYLIFFYVTGRRQRENKWTNEERREKNGLGILSFHQPLYTTYSLYQCGWGDHREFWKNLLIFLNGRSVSRTVLAIMLPMRFYTPQRLKSWTTNLLVPWREYKLWNGWIFFHVQFVFKNVQNVVFMLSKAF